MLLVVHLPLLLVVQLLQALHLLLVAGGATATGAATATGGWWSLTSLTVPTFSRTYVRCICKTKNNHTHATVYTGCLSMLDK